MLFITPKTGATGKTHTVKHGDTLWKISKQYLVKGSRYTEIVKLNGLKSNVLKTGQVLKIPEK
ncbi:MAG: LysM peptidoglycan-binding domain-containing protein [Clostridiales bacterium]|nr:LysM peptidoglycan-binding domain-containing protein [Clostridiales bacterium]